MRRIALSITVALGLGLALGGASASAQSQHPQAPSRPPPALDVPYLPQSELLCGGAAVAMVERWWGRRGVYAADFSGLVRPELRGIRTTDLATAARARGWETRTFDGSPAEVQLILAQRVPVIALIEVAPDRFHYVVLLGWSGGQVRFHDPARAPSRSIDEAQFLAEWSGAERWAMVLLPAPQFPPDSLPGVRTLPASLAVAELRSTTGAMPCRPWLDRSLDAVAADRLEDASNLLAEAGRFCPAEPMVLRELAGVRFKQGRLLEATRLSGQYLGRVPGDPLGWQLLAASRYLTGDREGALRAWNQIDRPTVDLIRIDGIRRMKFRIIADAMALPHGTVLTPSRLALARRRIAELPAVRRSAVEYQPVEGGRVEMRAVVTERPVLGTAWRLLTSGGISAITKSEVAVSIASPTGAGELWTGDWRWARAYPRVAVRVSVPARLGVSGVVTVGGAWERYRFALDTARTGVFEERRHSGTVAFGGWIHPALRPFVGLGFERWSGAREYLSATAGMEFREASDRFVLMTSVARAQTVTSHPSYTQGYLRAMWAASSGLRQATWSARLGIDLTSQQAPLGAWPVASTSISSTIPLRAHSRISNGLLRSTTTGRRILHGGLSGEHPVLHAGPFILAAGLFLDGAEVMSPANGSGRSRLFLDAGGGIRIGIQDGQLGVLRVDLATGLTDHRSALTVGLHQRWPPFRETTR